MPPKRRKTVFSSAAAASQKRRRLEEDEVARRQRLDSGRDRVARARAEQGEAARQWRLDSDRHRSATARANENELDRQRRLQINRDTTARTRVDEHIVARQERLAADRNRTAAARAAEDELARQERLAADCNRTAAARTAEDELARHERLASDCNRTAAARAAEDELARQERLAAHCNRTAAARAAEDELARQRRLHSDRERHTATRVRQQPNIPPALNYDAAQPPLPCCIGSMTNVCVNCGAMKWKGEAPGMCCSSGKVKLATLQDPPLLLKSLLLGDSETSRHFLTNIRKYNSAFQMTSMGCNEIKETHGWNPCFKVQGQVYHLIGSLCPLPNEESKFAQIYFLGDVEREIQVRQGIVPGLRINIIEGLQNMLHAINRYVQSFKLAKDVLREYDQQYKVVIHADKRPPREHRGRFNAPMCDEVAVLMVTEEHGKRDIVLRKSDGSLTRIAETHRSYDALQYPLILPHGDDGYYFPDQPVPNQYKVSAMKHYAYRLMMRGGADFNILLRCQRLMQQYVVDMYAKIETERLCFLRREQTKLRAEQYGELRDALLASDGDPTNIGKTVILPSSYTGGPRYMHERTQDAMCYVRKFGRPSLFITMTCNPGWKEITDELLPMQTAQHRPDLIARVFNLKRKELIKQLTKHCIFGKTIAYLCSIEWQKRGLPHAHILVWLPAEHSIHADDIDAAISAELPDPNSDKVLFDIVMTNMIHGPCGRMDKHSPCMRDGACTKRYPKEFKSDTQSGHDGYPSYRRRKPDDCGHQGIKKIKGNDVCIDNRWVVPYSPYLCRMFACHINVELCTSVKSIKYVLKYVNKGRDMAVFSLEKSQPIDEIDLYQTARYVSCSEACWRILNFTIHDRHPAVTNLHVHLLNGQRVVYNDQNAVALAQRPPKTTLTAFFDLCARYRPDLDQLATPDQRFVQNLLYVNVPEYFTFHSGTKTWNPRRLGTAVYSDGQITSFKKSEVIGRVYAVHPKQQECFFLRLLLHHKRGPCSFDDLLTIDARKCQTFREACNCMGLLEEDLHWAMAMQEAAMRAGASTLRALFAVILTTCDVADPLAIWSAYRNDMTDDILHQCRREARQPDMDYSDDMYNECLFRLQELVQQMSGQKLEEYGLPPVNRGHEDRLTVDLLREKSYDREALQQFVDENETNLTIDQRNIDLRITDMVDHGQGGIIFIDAPGGTGKTYLINLSLARLRSRGFVALAVASSGIAAQLLSNGKTAHSTFKIPLNLMTTDLPMCNLKRGSSKATLLQECAVIFWDEATMANKLAFEALDRTLQDLRQSSRPFGGILVVLSGDFRQTLPVIRGGTRANEIDACIKSSHLWQHVETHSLTTNMRAYLYGDANAAEFASLLLRVGNGHIPVVEGRHTIFIPEDLGTVTDSPQTLIERVYPNLQHHYQDFEWLMQRAILAPHNVSIRDINWEMLQLFPGEIKIYKSIDTVRDDDAVHYPSEFLNSLEPAGMPPHKLALKVGIPLMVVRNLAPGIANGTRLILKRMMNNCLEATIATGPHKAQDVYLPKIPLIPSDTGLPFEFKRLQFPVKESELNKFSFNSIAVVYVLTASCV
ncbi:uncharacterized protein LOC134193499 [Corticium candelabrum]|uniref:uncharacterized protein LOC134193499 n=1 Tax=Corticium candelabrum TaxID=121492 RepID=UPI002E258E5B|nr:uncharacterized protein LOC134193499 [Corticium candelabrum]